MTKIIRTPECEDDLFEIWRYIKQNNHTAADRFILFLNTKFQSLAESGQMGRQRNELAENLRSFAIGNYVIFYRIIKDGIQIIRVLHGSRDIESYFE